MAEQREDEHRQVRLGYRPLRTTAARHTNRSFSATVEEYIAWGEAQGGRGGRPWGRTHLKERRSKLAWWEERLGLSTLGDLAGILPRVETALRELQFSGRNGKGPGLTGKTLSNYAEALKSFCNWAQKRSYIDTDPLASLAGFDTSPRKVRRALTPEEIRKIIYAAPEHRQILYMVAFTTGLRAGELRSLTPDSIDVENGLLVLDAAWTKNRQPGLQPIPIPLAERLMDYGSSGQAKRLYNRHYGRKDARPAGIPEDPLLFVPTHTARDFRIDLDAAGVPATIPGQGKVYFHSCRISYVTLVVEAGASVKEGQTLARHSTPGLTMKVYARTRDERLAEIVDQVADKVLPEPECAICVSQGENDADGGSDISNYCLELDADERWWRRRDSKLLPAFTLRCTEPAHFHDTIATIPNTS